MRCVKLLLIGSLLLAAAGCRGSCGGDGGWFGRLTHRGAECPPMVMGAPMMEGCADCNTSGMPPPALPEGEPILTAPQKLDTPPAKTAPGYAEPMPFTPKK